MARKYDYHKKTIGESYYGVRKKKKGKLWRIFFLLVVFAFIASLFIYVFPKVNITIVPETISVENDFELTISSQVDEFKVVDNIFPAELIQIEDAVKKSFAATGEKNVGEKATGEVVFYNQTGLVQPLTSNNKLVTDDGIVFYLTDNVEIPKAEVSAEGNIVYGTLRADIIAVEAGEEGNISPGRLTIIDLPFSKQNKIYGEVKSKLTGGTSKIINVVSEDDLSQARDELEDELKPKLEEKVRDLLTADQYLDENLVIFEVVAENKAVELQEETDEFDMEVGGKMRALVWDRQKIKGRILEKINSQVEKGKRVVETSSDVFEIEVVEANLQEGAAELKIHTRNQVSLPIDIANLKDELEGMSEYEARRFLLSQSNIKDVRFKFNYSITSRIPENGNRINIELNF